VFRWAATRTRAIVPDKAPMPETAAKTVQHLNSQRRLEGGFPS